MSNPYSQPFPAVLAQLEKGSLANQATEALEQIVAGVVSIGKAGSLTLKLTVRPAAKRSDMVVIESAITVRAPEPDRPGSFFFATDDGGLAREDPNQPLLPGVLRPVADAEE